MLLFGATHTSILLLQYVVIAIILRLGDEFICAQHSADVFVRFFFFFFFSSKLEGFAPPVHTCVTYQRLACFIDIWNGICDIGPQAV